jgi:DNA adenine methylase
MIKSPIKSYGGKGVGFMKHFENFMPKEYDAFIEPFCGSAVVALNLSKGNCATIINDKNQNIFNFFKVLSDKDKFNQLKEKLDIILYSEDIFRESLKILKGIQLKSNYETDLTDIERAYHFFIVNRMSFSGNMQSWGRALTIRRGVAKSVSDLFSTIDGLQEIYERIQNYIICNWDGVDLIKNYDNPKYFYFLDPPYTWDTRTNARYPVDMTMEEQEILVNTLLENKSMMMLCGYDNQLYNEQLVVKGGWEKYEYNIKTITGKNEKKDKTEVLYLSPTLLKNI